MQRDQMAANAYSKFSNGIWVSGILFEAWKYVRKLYRVAYEK